MSIMQAIGLVCLPLVMFLYFIKFANSHYGSHKYHFIIFLMWFDGKNKILFLFLRKDDLAKIGFGTYPYFYLYFFDIILWLLF